MTEHDDAQPAQGSTARGGGSRSWWPLLAPAAAFLVGLLLGGVLIGVLGDDDATSTDDPEAGASPGSGAATASPSPGDTTVVVPEECLAAVDSVEAALDLADRSAGAVRDFQTDELRSLLRELEQLDEQARSQAEACQEVQAQTE